MLGTPAKAYLLADPEHKELGIQHDTDRHITTIDVPGEAPDPHNSVIVLEFDASIEIDKAARGRYHWSKSTGVEHGRKKQKRTK